MPDHADMDAKPPPELHRVVVRPECSHCNGHMSLRPQSAPAQFGVSFVA